MPLSGQRSRRAGSSGTRVTAGRQGKGASGSVPPHPPRRRTLDPPTLSPTIQGPERGLNLVVPGMGPEVRVARHHLHLVGVLPPRQRTPFRAKRTRPPTGPGSSKR